MILLDFRKRQVALYTVFRYNVFSERRKKPDTQSIKTVDKGAEADDGTANGEEDRIY